MDKLNVFGGGLSYPPGEENRLTWALMNLIRISPIIRAAFLDLVRDKQEQPIPALTALRERECVVQTQTGNLVAQEGRLVAIGITAENMNVDVGVRPDDRKAIYDGVVTFVAPEGRRHQQESLTLTVECKLGAEVEAWQLMPSAASLGDQITVDPQAVILAWRDIISTLTDIELRELVSPAEKVIIRDFIDYVIAYPKNYRKLNPFDHFAVCRDDLYLLNRRCEAILREIDPTPAWHRTSPIIAVNFPSFKQIWLYAEQDDAGSWQIALQILPGDTMAQARNFWYNDHNNAADLLALQNNGWRLKPNLHFSYIATHLHRADTSLEVNEYIELWEPDEMEITSLYRDDAGSYRHNWDRLSGIGLISHDDVQPLEEKTTRTNRDRISMSPGLDISYTWSAARASQRDRDGAFVREVKERIREATETWGEVPDFCRQMV